MTTMLGPLLELLELLRLAGTVVLMREFCIVKGRLLGVELADEVDSIADLATIKGWRRTTVLVEALLLMEERDERLFLELVKSMLRFTLLGKDESPPTAAAAWMFDKIGGVVG